MFLQVAAVLGQVAVGHFVPRWAFTYAPNEDERQEAQRLFGDPNAWTVLPCAQLQISHDMDGYFASKPTWETGPKRGRTLEELHAQFDPSSYPGRAR